jgi:hypothetical protein
MKAYSGCKPGIGSVEGCGRLPSQEKALRFMGLLAGDLLHQLITNPSVCSCSGEGYLPVAGFALPFGIRVAALAFTLGLAFAGLLWVAVSSATASKLAIW